jgi:hypothetical protein
MKVHSLRGSHYEIKEQLNSIVDQLKRQADSMYDGKPWNAVSYPDFGNRLLEYSKSLAALGEHFNSGSPPQWKVEQEAAYERAAIGRLSKGADPDRVNG